jgi:DMSO/TMAO reductase YedYZ molybdopterin-dependent catalytic subunit
MGNIFLGKGTSLGVAIGIFGLFVLAIIAIHVWATGISLKRPRAVQNKLGTVIEPVRLALFGRMVQRSYYSKSDITPFFRANGYPPNTQEYKQLLDNNFANWKFKIHGLVENPLELSLTDLHAMKKQMQITEHSCIQGWTAIGEWGGVSMNYIISLCRPLPQARYVVFYSYQYTDGTQFY